MQYEIIEPMFPDKRGKGYSSEHATVIPFNNAAPGQMGDNTPLKQTPFWERPHTHSHQMS